jgi:serine/threonine protein kinase
MNFTGNFYEKEINYITDNFPEFEINRINSEGCNGVVLLGFHRKLQKDVAIKIYDHAIDDSIQEPSLFSSIEHDNVIKVYDARSIDNETSYFMMEYANQGSLMDYITNNKLNYNTSLKMLLELLAALSYLHNEKLILHRDLKPENILVKNNKILIGDFGSACRFDRLNRKARASKHSVLFRPPEAFGANGFFDHSSDIYQVGLIGYILFGAEYNKDLTYYLSDNQNNTLNKLYKKTNDSYLHDKYIDSCIEKLALRSKIFDPNKLPWYIPKRLKLILNKAVKKHGQRFNNESDLINALSKVPKNYPEWEKTEIGFEALNWKNYDYQLIKENDGYSLLKGKNNTNKKSRIIRSIQENELYDRIIKNHFRL